MSTYLLPNTRPSFGNTEAWDFTCDGQATRTRSEEATGGTYIHGAERAMRPDPKQEKMALRPSKSYNHSVLVHKSSAILRRSKPRSTPARAGSVRRPRTPIQRSLFLMPIENNHQNK